MRFGDGLVLIVDDKLSVAVYIDDTYVGSFELDNLDQFLRLRQLFLDVEFVCALTSEEARDTEAMLNG